MGILTLINATHSRILTSPRSTLTHVRASPQEERSPTSRPLQLRDRDHSFGDRLEPRYIFRAEPLDQWAITHSLKDGCF